MSASRVHWNQMRRLRMPWRFIRSRSGSPVDVVAMLVRLALWGVHLALRRPATISVGERRAKLRLPAARHAGSSAIYILREKYEPEFRYFEGALREGMVVIDGGASIGIYTALAGKCVGPSGRVLSFEPAATSYQALEYNIRLNGLENTIAFRAALSDHTGTAVLYHTGGGPHSYSLGADDTPDIGAERVETKAIDDVLQLAGLERLDVIKLDIQGAEELALRGGRNSIARFRPLILFELRRNLPPRLGLGFEGGWNFLREHGYRMFAVGEEESLVERTTPRGGNYFAIPSG